MPNVLASRLSREHAQELVRLERAELEKLAKIYEQARLELLGRLTALGAAQKADTFTAQALRATLAQVQAGIAAMQAKLVGEHQGAIESASQDGALQTLDEIAFWERAREFRGSAFGRIQTAALRSVAAQNGLLLQRFQASIATYGSTLVGDIQRRLALHIVTRSKWSDMATDVAGRLYAHGVKGSQWRAERIVRTELVNALNTGHHAGLVAASDVLPDLQKQWDSTLDSRTSRICLALNGQVRKVGELFEAHGKAIAHPPALPNCRSRVLAYRRAWLDLTEPADGESDNESRHPMSVKRRGNTLTIRVSAAPPRPRATPIRPVSLGATPFSILDGWTAASAEASGSRTIVGVITEPSGQRLLVGYDADGFHEFAAGGEIRRGADRAERIAIERRARLALAEGRLQVESRASALDVPSAEVLHTATREPLLAPPPLFSEPRAAVEWLKTSGLAKQVTGTTPDIATANEVNRALFDLLGRSGRRPLALFSYGGMRSRHAIAEAGWGAEIHLSTSYTDEKIRQVFSRERASRAAIARNRTERASELRAAIEGGEPRAAEELTRLGLRLERLDPRDRSVAIRAQLKRWRSELDRLAKPVADQHNVGDGVFDVLVHEIGHILHQRMPEGMAFGYQKLGGTSPSFEAIRKGKIGTRAREQVAVRVSDYATTSTHEHLAEAFAAYHRGELDRISEGAREVIEAVLATAP